MERIEELTRELIKLAGENNVVYQISAHGDRKSGTGNLFGDISILTKKENEYSVDRNIWIDNV